MTEAEIKALVRDALAELQALYSRIGGWRADYLGYLDQVDGFGYVGPLGWSEHDYQFLFANLLTARFQSETGLPMVHVEMPMRHGTRSDLPPTPAGAKEKRGVIDIVVTDPLLPTDPIEATEAFRSIKHLAFIEVKWFHKGSLGWLKGNWKRKVVEGVQPDLDRLSEHKKMGRCTYAGMLLIDDTAAYHSRYDELNWHEGAVDRLALLPIDSA
jgi:hypothetical protein